MSEKLKPCPFCGGEAMPAEVEQIEHSGWVGRIECGTCDAVFSLQYSANSPGKAGNEVISAWNRRELESASQHGGGEAFMPANTQEAHAFVAGLSASAGAESRRLSFPLPEGGTVAVIFPCDIEVESINMLAKMLIEMALRQLKDERAAPSAGNGGAEES